MIRKIENPAAFHFAHIAAFYVAKSGGRPDTIWSRDARRYKQDAEASLYIRNGRLEYSDGRYVISR